jgi:hypothetical protein
MVASITLSFLNFLLIYSFLKSLFFSVVHKYLTFPHIQPIYLLSFCCDFVCHSVNEVCIFSCLIIYM